jgi:hypothetical protein
MAAVYNTTGTLQSNAKVVIGSGTTNASGNLLVALSGSAQFTSGTSYACTGSYQTGQTGVAAITFTSQASTSFTLKADANKAVQFICIGN